MTRAKRGRGVGVTAVRVGATLAAGVPALLLFAGVARATPQSTDQQRCLNHLAKAAGDVVRQQGKANRACVRAAVNGQTSKLGDPGDTLTVAACLGNDVGGKVAKKQQRTVDQDLRHCQGGDAPGFAYAGAAALNGSAASAARGVVTALFGSDLAAALVDPDVDDGGADCQDEVLAGAHRILDDLWRVGRGGVKDGLRGHDRRAGAAPDLPAHSSDNLQGEILAQSFDDVKGKIDGEVQRLSGRVLLRCPGATTPLPQLFPGACAAAPTYAALAECVAGVARAAFYQSVGGAFAMTVACDLTDNGTHDGSCVSPAQLRHALDRMGYGPDAYTIARIQTLGLDGYIDEQLDPASIDDSAVESVIATTYPSQALSVVEVRDCYPNNGGGTCPGMVGGVKNDVWKQFEAAEIYRTLASHRQLEAALVDFWFNHFSVTGSVGQQKWNSPSYVRDSIRPYVLGNFEESVIRMARGPAMLDYLDQRLNQVGVPPGTGYNENFPRELLELHTMGVTGPYTESDVKEVARALTGWREEWNNEANFAPGYPGFRYQDTRHDYLGAKTVLGTVINSGGELEGFDAIALAARHPSTAHFICGKLVRRFVGDDPPYALVDRCAAQFQVLQDAPDQLRQVTRDILTSREFQLYPEYQRSKVKRPLVLVASLMRVIGADLHPSATDYRDLRMMLADLGERIRNAEPPTGYPDQSIAWASPGAMVQRFNLVEPIAQSYAGDWGISGAQPHADVVDAVAAVLFPLDGISTATRAAAIAYLDAISVTAPQAVEQAATFLLSSREFLTH